MSVLPVLELIKRLFYLFLSGKMSVLYDLGLVKCLFYFLGLVTMNSLHPKRSAELTKMRTSVTKENNILL